MNVGLIEGRHPLPVSEYLLPANATDLYGFQQDLYDAAAVAVARWCDNHPGETMDLYLTGLTIAALGATLMLFQLHADLRLDPPCVWTYDAASTEYKPVVVL